MDMHLGPLLDPRSILVGSDHFDDPVDIRLFQNLSALFLDNVPNIIAFPVRAWISVGV